MLSPSTSGLEKQGPEQPDAIIIKKWKKQSL